MNTKKTQLDITETEFEKIFEAIKADKISLGFHNNSTELTLSEDEKVKLNFPVIISKSDKKDNCYHIAINEDLNVAGRHRMLMRIHRVTGSWNNEGVLTVSHHQNADQNKYQKALKHKTITKVIQVNQLKNQNILNIKKEHENLLAVGQTRKKTFKFQDDYLLTMDMQGDISLSKFIKTIKTQNKLSANLILNLIEQINIALEKLHKTHVHCDIKPDNLQVKINGKGSLKVIPIDFGSAYSIDFLKKQAKVPDSEISIQGTGAYMARETYIDDQGSLKNEFAHSAYKKNFPGWNPKITPAIDIYSMGASLYEIITGTYIAKDKNLYSENQLTELIVKKILKCTDYEAKCIHSMINGMLRDNPAKRLTSKDIKMNLLLLDIDKKIEDLNNRNSLFYSKSNKKVEAFKQFKAFLNKYSGGGINKNNIYNQLNSIYKELNVHQFRFGFYEKNTSQQTDSAKLFFTTLTKLGDEDITQWINEKKKATDENKASNNIYHTLPFDRGGKV